MGRRWLIIEDGKAAFNIFYGVYDIGALGIPGNFSRAGPAIAVVAMIFMALANIYSSMCICKVMLLTPKSVKTFGDLGEWCWGATGRYLSVISQVGSCLLIPCVFLVLGGDMLDGLFAGAFSQTTWIIFMALMVLPVCFIPTLKEGAGAAFTGCMGTILADAIGVAVVMYGMRGHPSVPFPELSFRQVASAFGNLSLAYGTGITIPDVHRQHSEPTRMPMVVGVTVTFISCLFLTLASTGYSAVGCQISGNLLFTIYPNAITGLTDLGFKSDWGSVVLAYLFMQTHITIAFSILANPTFYISQRLVLGMHKREDKVTETGVGYVDVATPARISADGAVGIEKGDDRTSKASFFSVMANENTSEYNDEHEHEAAEYRGANIIKYIVLRVSIVTVLVVLSIVFKDDFSAPSDFVGTSCITVNSILLPIIYYFVKAWDKIPMYEKVPEVIFVVVCFVLGYYVTYTSGEELFAPEDSGVNFPFCAPEYEDQCITTTQPSTANPRVNEMRS